MYQDLLTIFTLLQMFVKALREMANPQGSSIQSVERHIRKIYTVEVDSGYLLEDLLRSSARKAVGKNLVTHDGSYTYFKSTSAFKKSSIKPKLSTSVSNSSPILSSFTPKVTSKVTTTSSAPSLPSILEDKYEDSVSLIQIFR